MSLGRSIEGSLMAGSTQRRRGLARMPEPAQAVRRPTAVDLIGRDLVFTQRRLLPPSELQREARDCGLILLDGDLERLHRSRILVPLFWVRRPRWDIESRKRASSPTRPMDRAWTIPTDGWELREDHEAGLVSIGAEHRFRPWVREEIETATGTVDRGSYLYSPWQLLDLSRSGGVLGHLRAQPAKRPPWASIELRVAKERRPASDARTILLSALETRFYPRIVQRVTMSALHGTNAWRKSDARFDAPAKSGIGSVGSRTSCTPRRASCCSPRRRSIHWTPGSTYSARSPRISGGNSGGRRGWRWTCGSPAR